MGLYPKGSLLIREVRKLRKGQTFSNKVLTKRNLFHCDTILSHSR